MKKRLFIVGNFTYHPEFQWKFNTFFLNEEELLEEISSEKFTKATDYSFRGSLRTVRENVFILEFTQRDGKVLRDDLINKVIERINSRLADNYFKMGFVNSPLEIQLVDLDLSVRALNVLKDRKIPTLGILAERTVSNEGKTFTPIKAKNAGKKTNGEFKEMLTYYRLLNGEFPNRDAFC